MPWPFPKASRTRASGLLNCARLSTPLLWAAYNSDVESARLLIRAGAKADVANRYGITPLLHASRIGDEAMIKALLDGGANPALTHPDGETTLMGAARTGSVAAVRLLLDRKVDDNARATFVTGDGYRLPSGEPGRTEPGRPP